MTDLPRLKLSFFQAVFVFSVIVSLAVIGWHLQIYLLPLAFLALGYFSYLAHPRKAMLWFLFFLPFINSLPDLLYAGYPYNYIAIPLFYVSGMILASMTKREHLEFRHSFWGIYRIFLTIMILSIIFVFLRWSNITLSPEAFFMDTPVTPSGERVSFAVLFPVLTLFLFAIPPFVVPLLHRHNLDEVAVLHPLRLGYAVSFVLALIQRFVSPDFLCRPVWAQYRQYNGGNSDFNAFGFFGGFIFLAQTIIIIRRWNDQKSQKAIIPDLIIFGVSFAGIILSGSRTAFLFVIAALIHFLSSASIQKKLKTAAVFLLIILFATAGGVLKERLVKTIDKFVAGVKTQDLEYALDRATNKRITMLKDSGALLAKHWSSGVGTGNFLFYHKYMHHNEEFLHDLPLNQYLLLLDETGITGLLLFLWFLAAVIRRRERTIFAPVFYTILAALLVGNSLWLPELAVLTWIVVAMMAKIEIAYTEPLKKKSTATLAVIVIFFLFSNIRSFQSLHPVSWSEETGTRYDYGFWQPDPGPEGNVFRWTKGSAGLYVWEPEGKVVNIFAGAPVHKLEGKRQAAELYWNGKPFKIAIFQENRLESTPLPFTAPGFLELRIIPTFNLKRMGLGPEARDLGVQFYHFNSTHN